MFIAFVLLLTCSQTVHAVNSCVMLRNNPLSRLCALDTKQTRTVAVGFALGALLFNWASDYCFCFGHFFNHGQIAARRTNGNNDDDNNNRDRSLEGAARSWAIAMLGLKGAAYTSAALAGSFALRSLWLAAVKR